MKRVLIITDDFNEVTFLETLLKKIGFDALGVQSVSQATEQTMVMSPDMIILAENIKGHSSSALLENLMSIRPSLLVLLLKRDLKTPSAHVTEFINRVVKTPVDPVDLIRNICQVGKLKEEQFLEKYSKLGLFKGDASADAAIKVSGKNEALSDNQFVKNLNHVSAKTDTVRKARLDAAAKKMPEPKSHAFSHKEALKEVQELRARAQDPEIQKIDEQRKSFVRALFKK